MRRAGEAARAVVIGVGNLWRGDDAAGLHVARALRAASLPQGVRVVEQSGESSALLAEWQEAQTVIVVDAMRCGASPGTVHRYAAHRAALPAQGFRHSTHALGVAEAIELARALDQLPLECWVYGIEGESFAHGAPLSPAVQSVIPEVVRAILRQLAGQNPELPCTSGP